LRDIWTEKSFEGIQQLAAGSGTPWTIGIHLADVVVGEAAHDFLAKCLARAADS
jgi:hypothetical protein